MDMLKHCNSVSLESGYRFWPKKPRKYENMIFLVSRKYCKTTKQFLDVYFQKWSVFNMFSFHKVIDTEQEILAQNLASKISQVLQRKPEQLPCFTNSDFSQPKTFTFKGSYALIKRTISIRMRIIRLFRQKIPKHVSFSRESGLELTCRRRATVHEHNS